MSQELAIHQVNSLYEDCAKGLRMERKYIRTRSNGKNVGDWLSRRLNKVTDEFHNSNWKSIRRNVPKRHRAQMDRFFALWDGYFQQGIESVHSEMKERRPGEKSKSFRRAIKMHYEWRLQAGGIIEDIVCWLCRKRGAPKLTTALNNFERCLVERLGRGQHASTVQM